MGAIVSGDSAIAVRLLDASPLLARERAAHGATRQAAKRNFFDRILHYMYEGDTALHMAAAAYQTGIVEELIARARTFARGTDAAQNPFTMPLMAGPAYWHGIQAPRQRSLLGSFGLAPIQMPSTRVGSLRFTAQCAIAAQLP